MKEVFYCVCLFLCSNFAYSQQYAIKGRIVDENSLPIEFVSVHILRDDSLISSQMSDSLGYFLFQLDTGKYQLNVRYLGFNFLEQSIDLTNDIDLGDIKIDEAKYQELESVDVVVRRKTVEQLPDRLVFHVENIPALVGKDAFDALKLAPRLHVSDKAISIAGRKGVRLMVNERLMPMVGDEIVEYLKNISAEDIKSIEIIANPPAKYSAEGVTGLINIVTKKQQSDSWNTRLTATYMQFTYPLGRVGMSANLKKGKWELSSSANYLNGAARAVETGKYYYPTGTWTDYSQRKDHWRTTYIDISPTYHINDKLTTGLRYDYYLAKPFSDESDNTNIFATDNTIDSLIEGKGRKVDNGNSHAIGYFFVYEMDDLERTLSLDADYFQYDMLANRNYFHQMLLPSKVVIPGSYEQGRSFSSQAIQNYSLNLNMEHPFDWAVFEYGGRFSGLETKNNFEQYDVVAGKEIFDTGLSNRFNYQEQTLAGFASVDLEFGAMYGQLGVRYENTQTTGFSPTLNQTNKRNYDRWFPTVNIGYFLSEAQSLSLYYGNRINRPIYRNLNPFRWIADAYTYTTGNPDLRPYFMDVFELSHNFEGDFMGINSNVSYSFLKDGIEQLTIIENDIYKHFDWINCMNTQSFGFDQTYSFAFAEHWNARLNYFINYDLSSSDNEHTIKNKKGLNSMISLYNLFYINKSKSLSATINFEYFPQGVEGLGDVSSYNKLDLYFTWITLENKLSLSASISDVTSSYRPEYTYISSGVRTSSKNYYDQRYLSISVSYKFGQDFYLQQREGKNEEERMRL